MANPVLNIHNRPLAGSPLIVEGLCKKLDNSERHVCGSETLAGDFNGDWLTNSLDEPEILRVIQLNNQNLTPWELATFDFNSDNLVDAGDIHGFCDVMKYQTGENCSILQQIPTVSTWGLVVLTLGSLIAGTVVLSRRRQPTDTSRLQFASPE